LAHGFVLGQKRSSQNHAADDSFRPFAQTDQKISPISQIRFQDFSRFVL
jgi:hypothetical protein